MSKHTPAPWTFVEGFLEEDKKVYDYWVRDAYGYGICEIGRRQSQEAEANARLIASAPELLEALKVIAETPAGSMTNDSEALRHMHNFMVGVARQAIAKSEGTL